MIFYIIMTMVSPIEQGQALISEKTRYCEIGQEQALNTVKTRFENNPNPLNNLSYHDLSHTKMVINNTEMILRTIRSVNPLLVSEEDIALGKLAAAFHDVVENWESQTTESDGRKMSKRKRANGQNETDSALEAVAFMNEINRIYGKGKEIFSEEDKEKVTGAILVTIPEFKEGKVIQPGLNPSTAIITRAVALADLGAAGLEKPERFLNDALALFREDNIDFPDFIKQTNLSNEIKEQLKTRMIKWLMFQGQFVKSREERLDKDLDGLEEDAKSAVRKLFNHFHDSESIVRETLEKTNKMTFEDLLKMFGY